jgi:AraC family transcriptional regulator
MIATTSPKWARGPTSLNAELAGSLEPGMTQAAPATLLETPSSSRSVSSEGYRAALHEILHALGDLLKEEPDSARACLQRASSALRVAPGVPEFGDTTPQRARQIIRGGLAPWQKRVLKTHIDTHLENTIRTTELAKLVQLSSFHFCRVFRVSFGHSPHCYLVQRRMERAQELMLTRKFPLGQIAADCGFSDQAHFTKLFRRFAGESPGEWRRTRFCGSVQGGHGVGDPDRRRPADQKTTNAAILNALAAPCWRDGRSAEIA